MFSGTETTQEQRSLVERPFRVAFHRTIAISELQLGAEFAN